MRAPFVGSRRRRGCELFEGITSPAREGPGCMTMAHNLSSRLFPRLCTAPARTLAASAGQERIYPFAAQGLGWMTASGQLWYDSKQVEGWQYTDTSAESHSIVVLGKRAVFFPEKAWFDTESGECGLLEISKSSKAAVASVDFEDGVAPAAYHYSLSEPTEPKNNTLWVRKDYSDDSFVCYRWYTATEEWVRQDKLLYRISFNYVDVGINPGDRLEVTSCASSETAFEGFLGLHRVVRTTPGLVVFECTPERKLLPRVCRSVSNTVVLTDFTMERRVPELAMVAVAGERIWGVDIDGSTLRASAPGDPFSWYSFDGYGGDSFALATAYPGVYTGIGCLDDMPVFFKPDRIIRIKGSRPDNYSLHSESAPGLAEGGESALCSDGRAIYYCGPAGVRRCDGSGTEPLFEYEFSGRVKAACDGRFCYFADEGGFAVYDLENRVLCTEEGSAEALFCHPARIHLLCNEQGEWNIYRIGDGSLDGEWLLESRAFAPSDSFGATAHSLALDVESSSELPILVEFGYDGCFEEVSELCFEGRLRLEVALPQRKCSTVAYRLRGRGPFVLREAAVFTVE